MKNKNKNYNVRPVPNPIEKSLKRVKINTYSTCIHNGWLSTDTPIKGGDVLLGAARMVTDIPCYTHRDSLYLETG